MDWMRTFYEASAGRPRIIGGMHDELDRSAPATRVLSVTLPEPEWRAFLETEADPTGWLRRQIQARLGRTGKRNEQLCGAA